MKIKYPLEEVKAAKDPLQSFANRLFLEPIFDRTTWLVANFTNLTATQLSIIGFIFGIGAAVAFGFQYFIIGAILFEVMNLFDTFDGRIARLRKQSSKFGAFVDSYCGFWITFFIAFGLFYGVYHRVGNANILIIGFILYFLLILQFIAGNIVGFIIGGSEKYKETVRTGETKSALDRVRNFLLKRGLREPFNMTDAQHIIFFLAPLTGLFYELFWLTIAGLFLNAAVWFLNYRNMLLQNS